MEIFLQTVGALNDETRVKLLGYIDKYGSICVCELEEAFGMIQSRISRHLKILKEAGFLAVERKGRWAYYSIRSPLDRFRQNVLKEIACLEMELPQCSKGCKRA
ncbi:MAG: metalloregulator ArsR/SmtB family transcription factor [Sulfurimonas sp.]